MAPSSADARATHPLELIPLFRHWQPSPLRNALYTGVWSSLIGFVLSTYNWLIAGRGDFLHYLLPILLVSNVVGYLVHGALIGIELVVGGRASRLNGGTRGVLRVLVVTICIAFGVLMANALLQGAEIWRALRSGELVMPVLLFSLVMAGFMLLVTRSNRMRLEQETLAAQQKEQLAEARLRALQAQIEPHFLYNTLANVLSLIDSQPPAARHMLERFIDYLRASLSASRASDATLGAELDLIGAYLDVIKVRMGARLCYRIEADDDVRAATIVPMLLQPLVENAVMHGLEAQIDGGEIVVHARREGEALRIEVRDSGVGLGKAPPRAGGGVGLANLRSRLRSLYGSAAQLQLLDNEPGGTTVRVLLPLTMVPPSTLPAR